MRFSVLIAATLVATATPAFADQLVATFAGVVRDQGEGGEIYVGKSFTATFAYDTSLGIRDQAGIYDAIKGGTSPYYFPPNTPNPLTKVTLNIEGTVFDLTAAWYGAATLSGQGNANIGTGYLTFYSYPSESLPGGGFFDDEISISGQSIDIPNSLDTPFATTLAPYGSSFFKYNRTDQFGANNFFRVALDANTLTVTPVPEAPEWAMMLAGLAAAGYAARRRAQATA